MKLDPMSLWDCVERLDPAVWILLSSTQAVEMTKAEVTLPWFCRVSEGPYRYCSCRSPLCFGHISILATSICTLDQTDLLLFLSS